MKINRTLAAGSALAVALAWATSPLAQLAPSAFTPETVLPDAPFGTLPIDPATINVDDINGYLATLLLGLSPDQQTELRQRCVVITANAGTYTAPVVALCTAVVAQATPA